MRFLLLSLAATVVSAEVSWTELHRNECTYIHKRQYSSRLNILAGQEKMAEDLCETTPAFVEGEKFDGATRCVAKDNGEMWGEFDVIDPDCEPNWAATVGIETHVHKDDGCMRSGEFAEKRKYSARLWNIPSGTSWEEACEQTPHIFAGVTYDRPHRCVNEGIFGGMWGEWYIPDSTCEFEQPTWSRGEDDDLKRDGPLTGWIDLHAHQMSHLGFGGVIFKGEPYGIPEEALPDCPSRIIEGHSAGHSRVEAIMQDDILGAVLATSRHNSGGNPNFPYWPRPNTYTHQMMYYEWVKRAYEGGLRALVAPCVNGDFMFGTRDNGLPDIIKGIPIATNPIYDLDDMATLRRQVEGLHLMEAWIDLQNGGPGQGWFRIVKTPGEYRNVVAEGKLAVILATEVDYPLSCRPGECNQADILQGVEELYQLGIRYVFPIHLKTNDFGGAAKYNILVAADTYNCRGYSQNCNELGLTENGHYMMQTLMRRGMMVDIGHHGHKALEGALALAEQFSYPGVVLGHAWFYDMIHGGGRTEITQTTDQVKRIVDLGGMIGVILGQGPLNWVAEYRPKNEGDTFIPHGCGESSQSFAQTYLWLKDLMGDRAYDGQMTIGTDFNGFAHMSGARFGDDACYGGNSDVIQPESTKVQYPFKLDPDLVPAATSNGVLPDMELYQFQSRVFDFNYDGAAHMGMMPDLLEDLRQQGMKRSDLEPVYRSAEYFVNMWEDAILTGAQIPPAGETQDEVHADETVETVDEVVASPSASWTKSPSPTIIAVIAGVISLAVLAVIAFLAFRAGKERGVRETLISSPFTLDV